MMFKQLFMPSKGNMRGTLHTHTHTHTYTHAHTHTHTNDRMTHRPMTQPQRTCHPTDRQADGPDPLTDRQSTGHSARTRVVPPSTQPRRALTAPVLLVVCTMCVCVASCSEPVHVQSGGQRQRHSAVHSNGGGGACAALCHAHSAPCRPSGPHAAPAILPPGRCPCHAMLPSVRRSCCVAPGRSAVTC